MCNNYPKTICAQPPQFGNVLQIKQLKWIDRFEEEIQFPGFFKKCIEGGIDYHFVSKIYDREIHHLAGLAYQVHIRFDTIERILGREYEDEFISELNTTIYKLSIF